MLAGLRKGLVMKGTVVRQDCHSIIGVDCTGMYDIINK
jgi:hypothetical protein